MMVVGEMVTKPAWLEGLIAQTFFSTCGSHENLRKNEMNIYCLNCCRSLCPHCVPSHQSHPLLQVRRYVYHDVARLDDLEKLIDCSSIQPYTINSSKVVFLNQRPHSRPCKGSTNFCINCERVLQEPFYYCSLSCKVDHVLMIEGDLSRILHGFDESEIAFSQFEGPLMDALEVPDDDHDRITPDSILHDPSQFKGSSNCSGNSKTNSGISQDSEATKKKKKNNNNNNNNVSDSIVLLSRRKGAPHRSPFF